MTQKLTNLVTLAETRTIAGVSSQFYHRNIIIAATINYKELHNQKTSFVLMYNDGNTYLNLIHLSCFNLNTN